MTEAMQLRKQNSGGFGSSGSSQENLSNAMYNAANYNTIMVEYANGDREMAVDVPASFIAQAKTPPRYPPQNARYQPTLSTFSPRSNDQNSSTSSRVSKSSSAGTGNGSVAGAGDRGPPPTGSRDHLKIERDGNLINRAVAPELPSRPGQNGQRNSSSSEYSYMNGQNGGHIDAYSEVTPSKEQYERIMKYQQEIKQQRVDKEARRREEEFLRSSLRQSDRLKSLENNLSQQSSHRNSILAGVSNAGFSSMGEESGPASAVLQQQPSYSQITEAISRLKLSLPKSSLDTLFSLEDLVRTPDFRIGLDVCTRLQASWNSNPDSAPTCCEAQELAEDCLSLSDGGAATGLELEPAAQELASILRKESLEGLLYVHDKLAERHTLLNSFGEEDVILDRVSHYAEPNIKVVKLEKSSEPLGATVKNEGDAVVVGRIIKGGVADRSGLLHEGEDEKNFQ